MIGIFKAIKILRQIKNGTFDSREFAGQEAGDLATGVLDLPIFLFGALASFCIIFGFTALWFGPVIILGILGLLFLIPVFILVKIKKKITEAIEKRINKKSPQ